MTSKPSSPTSVQLAHPPEGYEMRNKQMKIMKYNKFSGLATHQGLAVSLNLGVQYALSLIWLFM